MADVLVNCYNRTCGQTFDPSKNTDDACRYHPGGPIFHDALKGWSCCKKRSTDFTEFLNIPGCTRGKHCDVKPPEPEEDKEKPIIEVVETTVVNKPIEAPEVRPSIDEPKKELLIKTTSSYNKEKATQQLKKAATGEVALGTTCRNSSCKASYTNTSADDETCIHHSGAPVFHEGMKYWSCCERKTSDFTAFLEQRGCARGSHVWKKAEDEIVKCRYDWHQTGNFVTLSIFAKKANADLCKFYANPIALICNVFFEGGKRFDLSLELEGVVNLEESQVTMSATKIEVKLRKNRVGGWKNYATVLEIETPKDVVETEEVGAGDKVANVDDDGPPPLTNSDGEEDFDGIEDDDLSGIEDVEFD